MKTIDCLTDSGFDADINDWQERRKNNKAYWIAKKIQLPVFYLKMLPGRGKTLFADELAGWGSIATLTH